jgi:formylglycine-generating enzyme required for sulfatase activity
MNFESSMCFCVVIILISMSLLFSLFYSSGVYASDGSDLRKVNDVEESKPVIAFLREVIGEPNTFEGSSWYAGTWDSTLYLNAEHPKTIAIRMELLDKETHLPIRDVNVSLKGESGEALVNQSISDANSFSVQDVFVGPEKKELQEGEFRLDAISDSKGIVVFSLNWQKKYPWDSKVDDVQIIYSDDIDKVERLKIKHPRYKYIEVPVDFKNLVDMKQYEDTSQYNYNKVRKFKALWQNELKRENVKLFVLNLNEDFPDFNNTSSKREEFFEKVRDKDYGAVILDVNNLPNTEGKAKCGPYFVYSMGKILLERSMEQMENNEYRSISRNDAEVANEPLYSQRIMSSEKADETDRSRDEEIDSYEHLDRQYKLNESPESPTTTSARDDTTVEAQEPADGGIKPIVSRIGRGEKSTYLGDGVTLEFVLVPAGEFEMGSPATEKDRAADEGPVHRVRISKSFYMGKYEVTQNLYSAVMGSNPSMFKKGERPVERVTWEEAKAFCEKLSEKYGGSYRLPTEAEWEFACRAGTQTRFYFGDDSDYSQLEQYAWCSKNSGSTTQPVGSKKPNPFGLYDMHGNVWEWCSDWYTEDYYSQSPEVDPQGTLIGSKRVLRGGGWLLSGRCSRSAARGAGVPSGRSNRGGFRVVLDMD